jgi:DNA-binding transcriptional ArsR family regulator
MPKLVASPERVAALFDALGDRRRLALLSALGGGPKSIVELARGGEISRQALTKHLRILEGAGLVRGDRVGREVRFRIEREAMMQAQAFLTTVSAQWEDALQRLARHVEEH